MLVSTQEQLATVMIRERLTLNNPCQATLTIMNRTDSKVRSSEQNREKRNGSDKPAVAFPPTLVAYMPIR